MVGGVRAAPAQLSQIVGMWCSRCLGGHWPAWSENFEDARAEHAEKGNAPQQRPARLPLAGPGGSLAAPGPHPHPTRLGEHDACPYRDATKFTVSSRIMQQRMQASSGEQSQDGKGKKACVGISTPGVDVIRHRQSSASSPRWQRAVQHVQQSISQSVSVSSLSLFFSCLGRGRSKSEK